MTDESFLDKLRAPFAEPTPPVPPRRARDPFATSSGGGSYAETAVANEVEALRSALPGGRNAQLNTSAYSLGQLVAGGVLDYHDVAEQLTVVAREIGLDETEIAPTIRSGLKSGAQHPRTIPDRQDTPPWSSASPNGSSTQPYVVSSAARPAGPTTATTPPNGHAPQAGPAVDDASTSSTPQDSPSDPEALLEQHRAAHLLKITTAELYQQRARRDAKLILDAEDALKSFRVPPWRPTLTEELAVPDEPVSYRVEDVFPTGANVLLTAQFKAGKTTLVNALTRALADDEPFLNRFAVDPIDGRIALFNYEVDDRQYRRWLRQIGITNTDKVVVLNLRGYRMPVVVPHVEDWLVAWLTERDVKVWAVDPFARAFTGSGASENDNTEVGRFLDTLDVIKNRAGVGELLLPTHTGRAVMEQGDERARGATRLDDWADVRWMLTKDDDDVRYLRATGRDVEVPEEKLTYDEATRGFTFGGGDRAWEKRRRISDAAIEVITESPGITLTRLRTAVREKVEKAGSDTIDAAVAYAESRHLIHITKGGTGSATLHYPGAQI